jgi:glycosyltransferase involved in cell wall biosynthesis
VIVAILPALDEEAAIARVVRGVAPHVDRVIVVDNGSVDRTAGYAADAGADVVSEPRRGYGRACLAGVARARELGAEVLVFLDADGSDDPLDLPRVLEPLQSGAAELVLGVRSDSEPGSMTTAQRFGNWLAPWLMRRACGAAYRDMPPLKAITRAAFDGLDVTDTGHGFTIVLLLEAHTRQLKTHEIDVRCRRRLGGKSKVSGTLLGTARASFKIVGTIARYAVARRINAS